MTRKLREVVAWVAAGAGVLGGAALLLAGAFKLNAGVNAVIRLSYAHDRVAVALEKLARRNYARMLP